MYLLRPERCIVIRAGPAFASESSGGTIEGLGER